MTTHSAHGFVSYDTNGSPTFLPLKSVTAKVKIIDVSARVVLTQLYSNQRRNPECSSAQYIFPVPANGAVCAFKMQTADGSVVTGVVKERSKAEKEYQISISQNLFAGLLYEATPDVFVISIGAIPRGQDVEVTIMYVVALNDGDLPGYDQIQFMLPTYVATRYGTAPLEFDSPSSSTVNTMFAVSVDIQMPTEIVAVTSITHCIKVHRTTNANKSRPSVYTSKVTLDPAGPPPRLNRDFVLSIQASKLGQPRCVAERRVSEKTVALSLTFVPRFRMETVPAQEYLFLIDRSGSMAGNRIHNAKEALTLFLKSLPSHGTIFNIFSFGSSCSPMWPSSHKYTAGDIHTALEYVQSIEADYGGTEIRNALAHCLRSRNFMLPTSLFLVTDGEVFVEHQELYTLVGNEVAKATQSPNGAHLRLFTLGVGDAASTALCEGVARIGNGICLMSTQDEDMTQKCARLLLASTTPPSGSSKDVEIDWGYISSKQTNNASPTNRKADKGKGNVTVLYDEDYDPLATVRPKVVLPDPPVIQQAPSRIPDLYPANRFTVYAILHNTTEIPKTVTLRGTLPDGSKIALPPVQVHQIVEQQNDLPPVIHTLAANRLIQELEDGITDSQGSFDTNDKTLREAVIHTAVVRFSETYQLASKFASFIAVDYGGNTLPDDFSDDDIAGEDHNIKEELKHSGPANSNDLDNTKYNEHFVGDDDDEHSHGDEIYFDPDNATADVNHGGYYPFPSKNQPMQSAHQETSSGETRDVPNSSAFLDVPPSQPSKKSVSFTPALAPLVIEPPSSTTHSHASRSHGHSQMPAQKDTVYVHEPRTTTSRGRGMTTSTDPKTHSHSRSQVNPGTTTGHTSSKASGTRYMFDVVANKDALRQTPSQDSLFMPGAYPIIDRTVPSQPFMYHSSSAMYSIDQQRTGSASYILETVACSDAISSAVVGILEPIGPDSPTPTRPLYLLSATSKSGLYKAPRRVRPCAIAPAPWTTATPIVEAARLQSFDGSFDLNETLHTLLGNKVSVERLRAVIPRTIRGQQDDEKIWATVLAAAHFKKAFPNDKEVWIGLWNKAADYVKSKLGADVSFALLVDEASKFL